MGQSTSKNETKPLSQELKEVKEEHKAKANIKLKERKQKPQLEPTPSMPSLLPLPSSSNIPYEKLQRPASSYLPTVLSNRNCAEEVKEETLQKSKLNEDETNDDHVKKKPYMFEYITEEANNIPLGYSRAELNSGIYLKQRTMGYWVEKGNNCFMVLARALQITWIKDEQFWSWITIRDNDSLFEVAELLDVCWLEIHGKLDISYLNPDVRYKVLFVVKMREHGYGWEKPVNLRLKVPQTSPQIRTQNMENLSTKEWTELEAGIVTADTVRSGEMEFSLYDYTGGLWKRGLLVKGAVIRPDKDASAVFRKSRASFGSPLSFRMAATEGRH